MKPTAAMQLMLIIAFLHLNSIGWAQDRPTRSSVKPALTTPQETFEIDFEGGSISEYVAFLRTSPNYDDQMKPAPVNIVVTDSAKNFQLPEIKVKTNMVGALGLLEGCSTENSQIVVQLDPSESVTMIVVESSEVPTVTVINAKQLLDNIDMEDLLDVIDVGLTMQGNTTKVELKLHQKTGLLFAKGTRSGTQLVLGIVDELSGKPNRNRMSGMGMSGMGMGGMGMGGMGMGGGGMGMGGGGMEMNGEGDDEEGFGMESPGAAGFGGGMGAPGGMKAPGGSGLGGGMPGPTKSRKQPAKSPSGMKKN